jgi:hypothetical protein
MKYSIDVVSASSYCWDPPPTGQHVIVWPRSLLLPDGDATQVFGLERTAGDGSTWSDEDFQNYPFFNPIVTGFNPAARREVCDGYLLRKLKNFEPHLADRFTSYFSAVACLLVPVK